MPALHSKADWRQAHDELQERLVDWDPAGLVAAGGPPDEYFPLLFPLIHRLDTGAGPEETGNWLGRELSVRFAATPTDAEVQAFARRTAKWFHARWPAAAG
ncbi:MAG: hypothetical protein ACLPJH_10615 [Myxococcaceae bacterium]